MAARRLSSVLSRSLSASSPSGSFSLLRSLGKNLKFSTFCHLFFPFFFGYDGFDDDEACFPESCFVYFILFYFFIWFFLNQIFLGFGYLSPDLYMFDQRLELIFVTLMFVSFKLLEMVTFKSGSFSLQRGCWMGSQGRRKKICKCRLFF